MSGIKIGDAAQVFRRTPEIVTDKLYVPRDRAWPGLSPEQAYPRMAKSE